MRRFARFFLVLWMLLAVPAHALAADVMLLARAVNDAESAVLTRAPANDEHANCVMHEDPATCLACTVCATAASLIGTLGPQPVSMLVLRAQFVQRAAPVPLFLTDGLERPPRPSLG